MNTKALELVVVAEVAEFLERTADEAGVPVDEVVEAIVMGFREQQEDWQRQTLHLIPDHRDHGITPDIYRNAREIVAASSQGRLAEAFDVLRRCPEEVRVLVEATDGKRGSGL